MFLSCIKILSKITCYERLRNEQQISLDGMFPTRKLSSFVSFEVAECSVGWSRLQMNFVKSDDSFMLLLMDMTK